MPLVCAIEEITLWNLMIFIVMKKGCWKMLLSELALLQNTHLPLLKCIKLWGKWHLFILPSLHCHILICATCSRENPHFLKFCAVTRAVEQCTCAGYLCVPIEKGWNCHDHMSVRQGKEMMDDRKCEELLRKTLME